MAAAASSSSFMSAAADGCADALQKSADHVVRRSARHEKRRAECGDIALRRAARKIVAKDIRHPSIVDPPVLGADQRRTDRNSRLGLGEQFQREVHRPGREVLALRQHPVDRLAAVGAFPERRKRRARQRPAVAFDILQHHRERHVRRGEKPGRLDECRLRVERARRAPRSSRMDRRPCPARKDGS